MTASSKPISSATSLQPGASPAASDRQLYRTLYASRPAYGDSDHSQPARSLFASLKPRSVADIGCGNGHFCRWARERGCKRVIGVDLAARPARCAGVLWLHADAAALPLPDRCVEWVTSFDMLEHLPEPAVRLAIAEMARISTRGLLLKPAYRASVARGVHGENLHEIVQPPAWWLRLVRELLPRHRLELHDEAERSIVAYADINS